MKYSSYLLLIVLNLGWASTAPALVLNFQFAQNADLEQGSNPLSDDLLTNRVNIADIAVGDGTTLDLTATSSPNTLNSADNGIGGGNGTSSGAGRLGIGETASFAFNRAVTVSGFSLNELTGSDNCTYVTPTSGGSQSTTSANVTGLALPLNAGESITFSTTVGDGIRLATLTVNVTDPEEEVDYSDRYQVLRNSSSNVLDVLRNDSGSELTLVSLTAPTNGSAFISGTHVVYTPATTYVGADSFTYTTHDGLGSNATWTVALDVRQYPNFVLILTDDQGWTGLSVPMDTNRPSNYSAGHFFRYPALSKKVIFIEFYP